MMIKNIDTYMQWKSKVIAYLASLPLRKRGGGVCRIGLLERCTMSRDEGQAVSGPCSAGQVSL